MSLHSPMMDIIRFRMNSQSSMQNYPIDQHDKNIDQTNIIKKKSLQNIPLILKNMNPIQKYVHEYKISQSLNKYSRKRQQKHSPLYDPNLSRVGHIQKLYSITPNGKNPMKNNPHISKTSNNNHNNIYNNNKNLTQQQQQQQQELQQQKCYIKYSSISSHCTQNKIQALQKAQNQYVKLKQSISLPSKQQTTYKNHNKISKQSQNDSSQLITPIRRKTSISNYVNTKSIQILNKKKSKKRINASDIQKQLKNAVVQQNGKKYFADLYLMKKQRDKIMNQIFKNDKEKQQTMHKIYTNTFMKNNSNQNIIKANNDGSTKIIQNTSILIDMKKDNIKKLPRLPQSKLSLPINTMSYDQKMRMQQQNFVQQKILKQRSQKKQKMLKGRNMNWNVYYQMLALKKNQKSKLKKHCKFTQTYGED